MPEGPEVRVIADTIAEGVGKKLVKATHTQNKKYKWKRDGIPGWESFTAGKDYFWNLYEVETKGKLIRINFTRKEEELSMLSTLGLEGFWAWGVNTKHKMYKYKRVWFDFEDGTQLAYCDSRNFGTIRFMLTDKADKAISKIGWDLLVDPMPEAKWVALQSGKLLKKEIGEVLMRQSEFSGIGNIYKAETLFELGLDPRTLVEDIKPDDWKKINHSAHDIMKKSYQVKGSSVKSYAGGSFQRSLQVYKKKTCPQNHPIASVKQNKRTTWYCPTCQK
jgi:formamidopyrimidine-DNA glycosylase